MMLGNRPFRRTASMTGITVDMEIVEAAPPPPPHGAQRPIIGGQYDHMLSPRYNNIRKTNSSNIETADFLRSCGLCNRRLVPGRDIYMYRGDTAFCSLECREQQMKQDERKERRAKNGETRHPELVAAATEATGKSKTAVAA